MERSAGKGIIVAGQGLDGIAGSKISRMEDLRRFWSVGKGEYEYIILRT